MRRQEKPGGTSRRAGTTLPLTSISVKLLILITSVTRQTFHYQVFLKHLGNTTMSTLHLTFSLDFTCRAPNSLTGVRGKGLWHQ